MEFKNLKHADFHRNDIIHEEDFKKIENSGMRKKELMHAMICIQRQHKIEVDASMSKVTGLFRSQHMLLMYLSKNMGKTQTEISKDLQISTATVAVSLKKLEKEGYICKRMREDDNRYNEIEITEKGIEIINRSHDSFEKIDDKFFKGFTDAEIETFYSYLVRMKRNYDEMKEKEAGETDENVF